MQAYLSGKKLYLTAIAAIVALVWQALTASNFDLRGVLGHLDWPHLTEALGAIFMRMGIAKIGNGN